MEGIARAYLINQMIQGRLNLMLDFTGRFYTSNGMVVAVHKMKDETNPYWGHELLTEAPYRDERLFYWDDMGNCVRMEHPTLGVTRDSLGEFDLSRRVNPQSKEDSIECVDCLDCREYQKKVRKFGV